MSAQHHHTTSGRPAAPARILAQFCALVLAPPQLRRRDERGNNTIEMAIIIGVVIIVATLLGIAIKAAVDARLGGIK